MKGTVAGTVAERFNDNHAVPRYELEEWRGSYGVVAGITGREGGFDLSLAGGAPVSVVNARWRAFRDDVAQQFPGTVASRQQHGARIGIHEEPFSGLLVDEGLDGHATRVTGILLAITVADCIPIYLLHPGSGSVALLHAGWRGTAKGILPAGIERLCGVAGAEASDILMHCGVGICGDCYEVGPEVIKAVTGKQNGRPGQLDLRGVLTEQALELGIGQVSCSTWCSAHHGERFHSHRRSSGGGERMVAYLGRPMT